MTLDPNINPPEDQEARITALLLNQLPEAEAAQVRREIKESPELTQLAQRLKVTIELVGAAATEGWQVNGTTATGDSSEDGGPRLSDERREQLLGEFKLVRPAAFARQDRSWTLLVAAAATVMILACAVLFMPNLHRQEYAMRSQVWSKLSPGERGYFAATTPSGPADAATSDFSIQDADANWAFHEVNGGAAGVATTPAPGGPERARRLSVAGSGAPTYAPRGTAVVSGEPSAGHKLSVLNGNAPAAQSSFGVAASSSGLANDDYAVTLGKETVARELTEARRLPAVTATVTPAAPAAPPTSASAAEQPAIRTQMRYGGFGGGGVAGGVASTAAEERQKSVAERFDQFSAAHGQAGTTQLGFVPAQRDKALADETKSYFQLYDGASVPTLGDTPVLGRAFDSSEFNAESITVLEGIQTMTNVAGDHYSAQWVDGAGAGKRSLETEALRRGDSKAELAGLVTLGDREGSSPDRLLELHDKPARPEEAAKGEVFRKQVVEGGRLAQQVWDVKKDAEGEILSRRPTKPALEPQPEVSTRQMPFSTFSLNVSDVSFRLAEASLQQNRIPDAATVRSEEFINAFDYRDPEPAPGQAIGFTWERARYPFAHNRQLVRFAVKTAAAGRQSGRALNLVLLLDNSGSMERADRVDIIRQCLRVLGSQLQPQDKVTLVTFSRSPRLLAEAVPGNQFEQVFEKATGLTPEGGTNLEEALRLAYEAARRQFAAGALNRVVLLTDGAANLGNVEAATLKQMVETHRQKGIALDCFGIGWEGYNDDLLEELTRNGDGRYAFINSPDDAASDFAGKLAGALQVAASDVKVQIEFNPARVTVYRQVGYAKHQLTKEQFRDNTVDAAEIGAAESGNALYVVEVNAAGTGPLGTARVRYKIPGTNEYREQEWVLSENTPCPALDQSSPALRLSATAAAFAEWLVRSPYAAEVTPEKLQQLLNGVPEALGSDPRPAKLQSMIRQAGSIAGN